MNDSQTFHLLLALIGLIALALTLGVTAYLLAGNAQGTAAAWAGSGAVGLAITGLYGLLRLLV